MTGAQGAPVRWRRVRFALSWALGLTLVGIGIPHVVQVSWGGVLAALRPLGWPAMTALLGLWLAGLLVHTVVLTAAAPGLTRVRALTLNLTGSAVANVLPLGGAAGVELNRRMMRTWGLDTRTFAGFTFLTNLWDVGSKLLLPVVAVVLLAGAGESVTPGLRFASVAAGAAFAAVVAIATLLLSNPRWAVALGRVSALALRPWVRSGRRPEPDHSAALLDFRRQCRDLVGRGWTRMSAGISGYVALQGLLLGLCVHLTGAGNTWVEVLAAFALERLLTILPLTPGGVGVADLGLLGVLIALGGDPAGATAAAVLYRVFVFAVEIPVGGGALGLWLLGRRLGGRRPDLAGPAPDARRIAHVTDVFLPRRGGIETHVDDLVRHQRARGLHADVLTRTRAAGPDPAWVHRLPAAGARRVLHDYDVVHVHLSVFSPYGIAVARGAVAAGLPTVLTVHSLWRGTGSVVRLAARAFLGRWPVAWSAVSEAAAAPVRACLGGAEVTVLPNAVDVHAWRGLATRGDRGPVTLVSVMRLVPRKRPLQLLRVFARVRAATPDRDVRLVLAGDGMLRGRVERYVARHGLAGCVRVTGHVPRSQVRDELRQASVYVAPAPHESFGIAALEARCAGLPVVASRRSGVREFVRDRVEGALVADDRAMVAALVDLVRDDGLRRRITEHNQACAPRFDWDDALERTRDVYAVAAATVSRPDAAGAPAGLLARAV